MTNIKPFRINVPQADLDDLADRLARTRFAEELPGYGVPVARVREVIEYWRDSFDWRASRRGSNSYPQFTTEIDASTSTSCTSGRQCPARSADPHARLAGVDRRIPRRDRTADRGGLRPGDSVHARLRLLRSDDGKRLEPYRIAKAWATLMARLGYERYGAVGNDGGSMISPEIGRLAPQHVAGVHVTQIYSFPSGDPAEMADLNEKEAAALEHLTWFWESIGAFNTLQSQQPQTLAHALFDSPAGLAGWNGQLMLDQDVDFVVAQLAIYWLTGHGGVLDAAVLRGREGGAAHRADDGSVGTGRFRERFPVHPPVRERDHKNIVSWHTYDLGGHYAAHQATAGVGS